MGSLNAQSDENIVFTRVLRGPKVTRGDLGDPGDPRDPGDPGVLRDPVNCSLAPLID